MCHDRRQTIISIRLSQALNQVFLVRLHGDDTLVNGANLCILAYSPSVLSLLSLYVQLLLPATSKESVPWKSILLIIYEPLVDRNGLQSEWLILLRLH